ncbi:MAG: 16S rRNA pseudouridine(516) synthase, partial [Firmicutes bacterium]|nr:16S rRNA pseudouridine(516) synthase [Bacillota bacterium]
MERLDKVISNQTGYSRKEIKELIRKKRVTVNGEIAAKPELKVDPAADRISVDGQEISIQKFVYLMLNKPKGY